MLPTPEILGNIISNFKNQGYVQVPEYNRFGFISDTGSALVISRESGADTRIPYKKIEQGIEAIKQDRNIYNGGPSKLRKHGITHITSPVWALLHLVQLNEY